MFLYIKRYLFGIVALVIIILTLIIIKGKEEPEAELALSLHEESTEINNADEEIVQETDESMMVDIKGAVQKSGVYTLEKDTRIIDVIDLAGGFSANADEKQINLATRVHDEMYIYISLKLEKS